MFDLTIMSPQRVLYKDAVNSAFFEGDECEFELLSFHAHLISVLQTGRIIINGKKLIRIRKGIVKFYENKCMVLVEEADAGKIPAG